MSSESDLPAEHTTLLHEARPGIERLVAKMNGPADGVIFLVADADSALGKVIMRLGVPRHPRRRSVVMPLTRDDAIRAAGPLMGPGMSAKLAAHKGAAVLVMASGDARLIALDAPDVPDSPA